MMNKLKHWEAIQEKITWSSASSKVYSVSENSLTVVRQYVIFVNYNTKINLILRLVNYAN